MADWRRSDEWTQTHLGCPHQPSRRGILMALKHSPLSRIGASDRWAPGGRPGVAPGSKNVSSPQGVEGPAGHRFSRTTRETKA